MSAETQRLRILTWHVHGNYLYSLSHVPHEFLVPVTDPPRPGYAPLGTRIPWPANIREIPAERVRDTQFDCVLYQSAQNLEDADALLTDAQRALPCAFLEHNPPLPHPTDTVHPFHHPRGVLVHVTGYNAEMWDRAGVPARLIEHGVPVPQGVAYSGELARGIVVINHLERRGRRMGADLYAEMARSVPLDLIGMDSERSGGLGEVPNMEVAAFMARYRFYFSPIRYTSLGLSLIEAMLCGVPVVGYAAGELPCVITDGLDGYVDTRVDRLREAARYLCEHPAEAARVGAAGREMASRRFAMDRFVSDWLDLFRTLGVQR